LILRSVEILKHPSLIPHRSLMSFSKLTYHTNQMRQDAVENTEVIWTGARS